jgi:tRNA modification GTPase
MTDVRLLTPAGPGAVAVVLVSGTGALARVAELVSGRAPQATDAGGVRLVHLAAEGEDLDEALLHVRAADEVELHLHGSPPLVDEVLRLLGQGANSEAGVRLEDRARALLCASVCEAAARVALDQAEGALRRELEGLVPLTSADCAGALDTLILRGTHARFLFEPARLVLAGPVNAGKSTLFNVLVGEGRVVVSDAAGTTRDLVEEPARLGDWPVRLVDTAGLRELAGAAAPEQLERAGQELARAASLEADVVLWLVSVGVDEVAPPPGAVLVLSQADRLQRDAWPERALSAQGNPAAARDVVESIFRSRLELPAVAWQPGAGVPFDAASRAALAQLRSSLPGLDPADRPAALACLLH